MQVGFVVPHVGPGASPEAIDRTCSVAETLGADSLWVVDHIAIPFGFTAKYPYTSTGEWGASGDTPWWDCLSVMAYIAARTERVKLGTGVLILPYRHPLDTAKRIATIDVLSRGRVLFGAGVGWLQDEFEALGLGTYHRRGAVADEQLRVMKAAWRDDRASYDGRFYRFSNVSVTPKPAQRPHPPLLIGGNSAAALRRTVELGDGWHALSLSPAELAEHRQRLNLLAVQAGRDHEIPVSMLIGIQLTNDPALRATLTDDARRQAIVGTPEQVVGELRHYKESGLGHLMTSVRHGEGAFAGNLAAGMEFFMREIWPAVQSS